MKAQRDRQSSEHALRERWNGGDFSGTATLALECHGRDILTFLIWKLGSESDGAEAFSIFAEDMWGGLPKFEWRCSLHTWLYVLAHNAARRHARAPHRRRERSARTAASEQIEKLVESSRSVTPVYKRTHVKNSVRALRDRLPQEDQLLLVLRVDRGMSWRDLAFAINGDEQLQGQRLQREEVRLRKSFQRIKAALKRMAVEQGLLRTDSAQTSD